tara:strand:+ start:1263 stop:1796 length:534 start_codon:yes stop_codon:yes gene_type:complete
MDCGDTTMMYKELVKALITKRKKFRVDTMTVSQMIGVADSLVGDWERGRKFPSAANLFAWCNALEIDLVMRDYETECPPDFEATSAIIEWCQQQDINYDEEREKFTNYYISRGRTSHNWQSMFKLWVQRSIEFRRERESNNSNMDKTSASYVRARRERLLNMSNVSSKFLERKGKDK